MTQEDKACIINEKKAIDIALENVVEYHTIDDDGNEHLTHCYQECKKSALAMAQWKDGYYKKLLDLLVKSGADPNIITNYIENCIEL